MDLGLSGASALVTGASKGIGLASALLLAQEGCDVAINARGPELLEEQAARLAEETGRRVIALAGDMSDPSDAERVAQEAIAAFGRLDILVTCAGSSPGGLIEELTEEDWAQSLGLKFMGYVRSCKAVLPHMRERGSGSIVLVVGNDGLKPSFWELTPGAANAADLNFASAIADQYGRHGVRVNTVNPGPVNTDRWDGLEKGLARNKGVDQARAHEVAVASIPLGRICEPDEVANVVAFLASPRASFVNGAHIPVDGAQRKALLDL